MPGGESSLFRPFVNSREIALGQHHVAVEHNDPLASCALHPVVAALAGAAVLLIIIIQVKDARELIADILAGGFRTVFHHNHLKVLQRLPAQALQQLAHLIGTIEDGYDNLISHLSTF